MNPTDALSDLVSKATPTSHNGEINHEINHDKLPFPIRMHLMGIDGVNALRIMVRNDNTDEKLLKVEYFSDGHWKLGWYQGSYIREVPGKENYARVANAIQELLTNRYS